jgi:hypothetical protein
MEIAASHQIALPEVEEVAVRVGQAIPETPEIPALLQIPLAIIVFP